MRYGARLTHRWKDRLLTALAATVLLAASAGTALAQNTTGITITGPARNTINEGGTATYTVAIRGYVGVATDTNGDGTIQDTERTNPAAFNVTLGPPSVDSSTNAAQTGELADLNSNAHVLTVSFDPPANSSTTNRLLFTASKTISVVTLHDNDAENERFTLAFSASRTFTEVFQAATGADVIALADSTGTPALARYNPVALIIDDDETQTYTLTLETREPTEGAPITVHLEASPAHVNGSGSMNVILDKRAPAWTLAIGDADSANPAIVTAGDPDNTVELTITQADGDGNRVTDTVTVSAHTGVAGASVQQASLSIDVADGDVLQAVTAKVVNNDGVVLDPQPESVEEGESVKIAVMPLDDDGDVTTANEELTIVLASSGSANAADFRLSAPIKIGAGQNQSNSVDLIIEGDDADVGMEMLVLDATVSGDPDQGSETSMNEGVLTLAITDTTDRKIWPQSEADAGSEITGPMNDAAGNDGLNPGESFMVAMDDLFHLKAGYTATYGASSDGSAVSISERGDVLTIEAVESGTSTVTVTGTASAAASTFSPSQTISNVAHVAFDVTVVDKELVVTLAADPTEIDEGGTSTITAMANRAVVAGDGEVKVNLSVAPADAATLDAESITIAMGAMSGSTMLTATEDDADYADETVTVVASGSGIDGQTSVEITVTDNDEAPVAPEPENVIEAKSADEAYSAITDPLNAAAGDDGLNPGESFSVMASALFTVMEGYTASYSAAASGDAVSVSTSGDTVTVVAEAAGEATVTVTGTATSAGSSFEGNQVGTNVATVTFPVNVVYRGLVVTVSLSASDVEEGESVTLTATANRPVDADISLDVTVTGDSAAVSVGELSIAGGATEGTAAVMAVEDDDTANAAVTLVVSGSGIETPASISLSVTDNDRTVNMLTQAEVDAVFRVAIAEAAGGPMWAPGGNAATVDMSELFTIESGATVAYEAMSSDDGTVAASASGSMLTLSPEATGSATITVTATDTSGDAYDTATVSSMVSVGVLPLQLTWYVGQGGDDYNVENLVEGQEYEIIVNANRAITEAEGSVEVTFMRDRAASDADDSDYTVGVATLRAGRDHAHVRPPLMVLADDISEGGTDDGGNVGEQLVLFGVASNGAPVMPDPEHFSTDNGALTIWDTAVPALPVIATWLLGLGLLGGGARQMYLRRRQD